ncbi:hypothetical protein SNEBB_005320 [Seison nebaliae]|nr:hypothetical protein SNEBB_005320 [Seison nebaliae]
MIYFTLLTLFLLNNDKVLAEVEVICSTGSLPGTYQVILISALSILIVISIIFVILAATNRPQTKALSATDILAAKLALYDQQDKYLESNFGEKVEDESILENNNFNNIYDMESISDFSLSLDYTIPSENYSQQV